MTCFHAQFRCQETFCKALNFPQVGIFSERRKERADKAGRTEGGCREEGRVGRVRCTDPETPLPCDWQRPGMSAWTGLGELRTSDWTCPEKLRD